MADTQSMNLVVLIGTIGKDPTIQDAGNNKISKFSLATNETYKKGENYQKDVEWHNIVAWGWVAEKAGKLVKGQKVAIKGKLKTRKWEKDGIKFQATDIVAETITPITSPKTVDPHSVEPAAYDEGFNEDDPF